MSLKLQNLSKRYADRWILRDVSLEADTGEILGLIGDNAVGKSTVLRLISGEEKPNSGKVVFNGEDLSETPSKNRILSPAANREESSWKSFFKTGGQEEISDGQKQKMLIERNLESAQDILLIDTPFSGMNYELRDEIYGKLRETVKEKNLTAILATNNLEAAFAVCDKIAILQNGEIVQTGSPREVYEKPDSTAVARALGRINLIPAMRVTFNNQNSQEFQTLTGSHRISTDKSERRQLGAITAPVSLAIRPEHISISFGASFPEDNLLKATIINIRYLGASTLLTLDSDGLILESVVLRLVGLNVGDECMVGLPPDRILVLKH